MPIVNRIAGMKEEVAAWRQDFHANPELLYDVHRTAALVADQLRAFGCDEVTTGIGRTGVVAVIKGKTNASGKVIGLRADMDALPIEEETGLPYASKVAGKMHACGHDGHTAMLLGAAKYLSETRNFDGAAVIIFQPAEEGGAGGLAMVQDGLMDRWNIAEVYGMHNMPGLPVGKFVLRPGPIMAASDFFEVDIKGRGGHAAKPHDCVDPVMIGCQLNGLFQTVISRNIDPVKGGVISMTMFKAGTARNVIPETAYVAGTVRSLDARVRDTLERRMHEVCAGLGAAHGATVTLKYQRGYPVTVNHPAETAFAAQIARQVAGADNVNDAMAPLMGGEDFSYMLEARPGAFIFVGNGDTAGLHTPRYNFNDDALPVGMSFWARLVETAMPAR